MICLVKHLGNRVYIIWKTKMDEDVDDDDKDDDQDKVGGRVLMAPPRRLRRQNPKIGEDCEFQRTDIFRHFIRLAG